MNRTHQLGPINFGGNGSCDKIHIHTLLLQARRLLLKIFAECCSYWLKLWLLLLLVLSCSPFSSATCLKTHSLTFRGLRQLRFQLVTLTFPYYTYPDSGLHKGNFLDLFNADGWKFHHHIASTCMTSSFSLWLPVDRIQLDGGVSKINALLGVRTHKMKCY